MIDDSPPSLPPFLRSLLSLGQGAGSVARELLVAAHASPVPTLTAEGWGKAWSREAVPVEKPSSHPSLGGRGHSLHLIPTTHPATSVCRIFLLKCLFPYEILASGICLIFILGLCWGWLSGRSVCAWGSGGLFLKLYLPGFYLIKRMQQLCSKSWGVLMRIICSQLGVATPSPLPLHAWTRAPPLGLRLGAGWSLAYGESPSLCPPHPQSFTKNWPGSPRHRGNTQVGTLPPAPTFAAAFDRMPLPCPRQALPAVFQPRRHLTALSSPTATVTSAWVAPRRRGVPRTSSPVPTVGDQVMPPPEASGGQGPDLEARRWRSEDWGGCRASGGPRGSLLSMTGNSGFGEALGIRGCGGSGVASTATCLPWRGEQ